jgi:hypothetical protein
VSGTFTLLRQFDPAGVHAAAQAWRALSREAESADTRHRHQVNGPLRHAQWQGRDADSAFHTMERTEQILEVVRVEAEAAALILDTVADRMDQARTNLLNALRRADEWGLPVSPDGAVGLPPQAAAQRHDPDPGTAALMLLRSQLQARIDAAVAGAHEAGEQGAQALGRLDADILTAPRTFGAAAESARDAADVAKDLGLAAPAVPENTDPRRAAAWWAALTADQQQSLLALHPEEIGRLDGLPSAVRDRANRLLLEQQSDALHAGAPEGSGPTYGEYSRRENALRALKNRLDRADGDPKDRQLYLLALDPRGDGRAVVALGDPDTADHTAVLVPGTGTTLAGMPGQIDRAAALRSEAARSAGPGSRVSVISWLGYDAPELDASMATTDRAEQGAADMRRFTEGVRTAQGDRHGHLTVIGHSYGTTAVGVAARGGDGLHADDIIGVASPGMGTDRAEKLHIDPSHVWLGTAPDDMIDNAAGLTLGPDPARAEFGGRTFGVDTHGHSGYWDPDSQSLANQGRIIAGREPAPRPSPAPPASPHDEPAAPDRPRSRTAG